MAVQIWKDIVLNVGAVRLGGQGKNFTLNGEAPFLDTTPLSVTDGFRTGIAGLRKVSFGIDYMSEFAVTEGSSPDSLLNSYLGTAAVPVTIALGTAAGSRAYVFRSVPLEFTSFGGEVGTLAMGRISGETSQIPVGRGFLLQSAASAVTSSGNGTAVTVESTLGSSAETMYAVLHVTEHSGTSETLDVIVQSDTAGFPSPTNQVTFTQMTAKGYQWSSVAGPVTDQQWRVSYTIGGSGSPSFNF